MAVTLRSATPEDLDRVTEIEAASFAVPWSREAFRSLGELKRVRFLVAELEGGVVGHGVLWWVGSEGELANLAVDPAFRRQGVARVLLDGLLERARAEGLSRVFLEVRVSNHPAEALYRSRGFRPVGLRRNYYHHPREDARILRLQLARDPVGSEDPSSRGAAGTRDPV